MLRRSGLLAPGDAATMQPPGWFDSFAAVGALRGATRARKPPSAAGGQESAVSYLFIYIPQNPARFVRGSLWGVPAAAACSGDFSAVVVGLCGIKQ